MHLTDEEKQQIKEDSKIFAAIMGAISLGCIIVAFVIYVIAKF